MGLGPGECRLPPIACVVATCFTLVGGDFCGDMFHVTVCEGGTDTVVCVLAVDFSGVDEAQGRLAAPGSNREGTELAEVSMADVVSSEACVGSIFKAS